MYNCDQCRLPRVFVSFFSASWLNKRTWVLHIRFCFVLLWLPPSVVIFYDLCILLSFTHIYSLLFIYSSLPSNFFFLHINRSFLYCESRTMVMLVIMTFIYHIRSVMPFAHIYLYINTSRPNRLNSIEATSCVNNSPTDQSLTFSLFSSGYSS
jgi:hypothetical protein